jgi:hypothetical protein
MRMRVIILVVIPAEHIIFSGLYVAQTSKLMQEFGELAGQLLRWKTHGRDRRFGLRPLLFGGLPSLLGSFGSHAFQRIDGKDQEEIESTCQHANIWMFGYLEATTYT